MLTGSIKRLAGAARTAGARLAQTLRDAVRPKSTLGGFIADLTRTPAELRAENAALRQQLILLSRNAIKPKFNSLDRVVLVLASALTHTWCDALLLVKPETILRWHRQGFRLLWARKSQRHAKPQPKLSAKIIQLIKRMAAENRTWGAERVRGELLKLGIKVAKRTVQRHMNNVPPDGGGQTWSTFLKNHNVWACDFLQLYDCWFRPIFAFFIIDVNTKEVLHVAVTRSPSEIWTAQQLREATPFGEGADLIIRDRDAKFGAAFDRAAEGAGMRVVKTPVRTPNMNAVCERFLGSVRRECLDHILILSETQLRRLLTEYAFKYFNNARSHQGIGQRVPNWAHRKPGVPDLDVVALPILGGLHHDYRAAA